MAFLAGFLLGLIVHTYRREISNFIKSNYYEVKSSLGKHQ